MARTTATSCFTTWLGMLVILVGIHILYFLLSLVASVIPTPLLPIFSIGDTILSILPWMGIIIPTGTLYWNLFIHLMSRSVSFWNTT